VSYLLAAAHVLPLLIALGLAFLIVTTIVGLGVTELLLPASGFTLLIAPAVGLAILALAFQWIAYFAPPSIAAIGAFAGGGSLTAFVVWRRRQNLVTNARDLAGAGIVSLGFYIALLQMVITRGFLTLGGFPTDNVFIYVQAAQYLRDHPAPSTFQPIHLLNPGSGYLSAIGPAFPSPVGAIDAAASVLGGVPVYALFDPLNAFALAITVGPVWFFVRRLLGGSWWVAAAGCGLLVVNQLVYWVIGLGFQQETFALPIFTASLGILALALRERSARAGALAGLLGAAVVGVYLPMAVLLAVCAAGCALVVAAVEPRAGWRRLLRPVAGAAGAGAAASLAGLVVLFQGGFAVWESAVGVRVPAGAISQFPALPYIMGALPFAHTWGVNPQPYGRIERLVVPILILASILILILLIAGHVRAILQKHAPEAAILATGFLFVGYEAALAAYPYGFVKSVGYMIPLTSAFIAFGATGLGTLVPRAFARRAQIGGVAALGIILASSAVASRDMIHVFVYRDPSFTASYLDFAKIADVAPAGSSVLIAEPDADYTTLVKIAAVAYFLPDRPVRVYSGDVRLGTFYQQDVLPNACAFDYVVAAGPPAGDFKLVYSDSPESLNVYKRQGPACRSS
jgi:hypothetical protein